MLGLILQLSLILKISSSEIGSLSRTSNLTLTFTYKEQLLLIKQQYLRLVSKFVIYDLFGRHISELLCKRLVC